MCVFSLDNLQRRADNAARPQPVVPRLAALNSVEFIFFQGVEWGVCVVWYLQHAVFFC